MLLKWIVCRVAADKAAAFSQAQRAWGACADAVGFLGQAGGFAGDDACVAALWSDEPALAAFMAHLHDPIVAGTVQERTYESLETTPFRPLLRMRAASGARASLASVVDAVVDATVIRVADCRVRDGRADHFVDAQLRVWLPGMAAAPGMRGGFFSVSQEDPRRFLVVTGWDAAAAHDAYAKERVPELRAAASVDDDLESLRGHRVLCEPSWRVHP